jgi:AcrR family transcriptional regulator
VNPECLRQGVQCTCMAYPSKTGRAAILAAAMELLGREGLRGMSLRAVATSLQLAPNALYRYFADREHLEAAVAAEVAATLHAVLFQAGRRRPPEQSIRSIARAYMRFAKEQHWLYEALLVRRPVTGEDAVAPQQLWLFVVEQVSHLSGEARAPEAAVALWAFLHGMAALQSAEMFNQKKPFRSLEFGLNAWMEACKGSAHR